MTTPPPAHPLQLDDFGLNQQEILDASTQVAPALFIALRISHTLGSSHYPIESFEKLQKALGAGHHAFELGGMTVTIRSLEEYLPDDCFPLEDGMDVMRKVYLASVISQTEEGRKRWEQAKKGNELANASHPMPKEIP